eukprot:gnl/Spiro4/27705_TR13807_c0_g1_i1.p1 gnl/Spiro4/27705_TR13807_c0_g1~~gnl/Spiro4/27705_TR13807_c0_g1_i1.p1  ORF type:complete len:287 (-),score=87.15 gnl/Spiro4/27705_TR13807_c0_g1_i1:115-939(-)
MIQKSSFLCALILLFGACVVAAKRDENSVFQLVASLQQEDSAGLPGLSYDGTQPTVTNATKFTGLRIAFLVAHCFEEVELTFPWIYFNNRGADVQILAPSWTPSQGVVSCEYVRAHKWAAVSMNFKAAQAVKWDAIVVPGGVWSSTVVRNDADAIALIQQQYNAGALVATVCSGSTVLINAGLAAGRTLTGSPAIRIDLENAGAQYLDEPVVAESGNLITGRSPQGQDTQLFAEAIDQYLEKVVAAREASSSSGSRVSNLYNAISAAVRALFDA